MDNRLHQIVIMVRYLLMEYQPMVLFR